MIEYGNFIDSKKKQYMLSQCSQRKTIMSPYHAHLFSSIFPVKMQFTILDTHFKIMHDESTSTCTAVVQASDSMTASMWR